MYPIRIACICGLVDMALLYISFAALVNTFCDVCIRPCSVIIPFQNSEIVAPAAGGQHTSGFEQ